MRLLLALVILLLTASAARADPAVWRLRDADSEVLIFGSVHALTARTPWRSTTLERAVFRADRVVFEAPYEAVPPDVAAMSLAEAVGPDLWRRAATAAVDAGLSAGDLERLPPWRAAAALDAGWWRRIGRRQELGVDALARRRTPATSEVLHLDRQGLSALAELPMAAQRQLLERSVSDIEQRATYLDSDRRWARGDLGGVAEEVRSMRRGQPALYEALVAGRSRRWAPRIAALLAQPGSSVVIVGAGHMVGQDGLPALLRAQGLRVEGPTVR